MEHLDKNSNSSEASVRISDAERVLIRLGALLHDVSHVPLSHDLERKSHKIGKLIKVPSYYGHYEKHDDYEHNPLLYRLICDTDISVLARVLRSYSQPFYCLLTEYEPGKEPPSHLERFLEILRGLNPDNWSPKQELLPALLFHLLLHEDPEEASAVRKIAPDYDVEPLPWGLGPPADLQVQRNFHDSWYQPFRHAALTHVLYL
jgi:hypothetical protein